MSYQKSTRALKNEVLEMCGELTDGTSDFETAAVRYLNNLYQGLLSGGNEFGVDVADPWVWAQARRPITLSLQPSFSGVVSISKNSMVGVLSSPPAYSLEGWTFRVSNRYDVYRIVKHDAGDTDLQIDQPYLETGGSLAFSAYKTDYALVDDTIVIDNSNNKIDFTESGAGTYSAVIPRGAYLPAELALAIKTAMQTVGTQTYTVTFDTLTRKFTLAQGGAYFQLLFASGANAATSISQAIGFDIEDQTGALSYSGSYAQSGVLRLTKPIQTYRAGVDAGLIYMVDDNTFAREYGYENRDQLPDKFCISEQRPSGLWRIRMNASVFKEPIRCEVNYIPVARKLTDNDVSYPLVPGQGVEYLVFGAAHYLMTDKTDSKAEQFAALATTKLKAMVNDNRKNVSLAGSGYGRLVPRTSNSRRLWGW